MKTLQYEELKTARVIKQELILWWPHWLLTLLSNGVGIPNRLGFVMRS